MSNLVEPEPCGRIPRAGGVASSGGAPLPLRLSSTSDLREPWASITVIDTDFASLLAIMAGTIMMPAMNTGPRMVPITNALVRTRSMNSLFAMTRTSFMREPR